MDLSRSILKNFANTVSPSEKSDKQMFARGTAKIIGEEKYVSAIKKMAKIIGVSDEGHLIIEDEGNTKEVFIGEILR